MTACQVIAEITRIALGFGAKRLVLFGSRAKGTYLERSDIDIAVSGVEDMPRFRDYVDNIRTLYSVDIVDLDKLKDAALREDIEEYGRALL